MYVDTSVEEWDPYREVERPQERTLYHRHLTLREQAATWPANGPTAVVEHGANPGLVSHWTKRGADRHRDGRSSTARPCDDRRRAPHAGSTDALAGRDFAALAMHTGTKVIHISERDTQISADPKEAGEFVNTWSVEGFYEEGIAPAELGWGTHEDWLPERAYTHTGGPENQICLAKPGIDTLVRSWVPLGGPIIGMVVRHGEAFTISDAPHGASATARPSTGPTVHYAYLPTDAAMASLHECRMSGYELQDAKRIMNDEITEGMDELGVLLLGHDLNGWWVGSQLDIDETRALVPHQNATTLQVAASVLGAVFWMIEQPEPGPVRARRPRPRGRARASPTPTSARARRCRPTGRPSPRRPRPVGRLPHAARTRPPGPSPSSSSANESTNWAACASSRQLGGRRVGVCRPGLGRGAPADAAVGALVVVVGDERVELGLQLVEVGGEAAGGAATS